MRQVSRTMWALVALGVAILAVVLISLALFPE